MKPRGKLFDKTKNMKLNSILGTRTCTHFSCYYNFLKNKKALCNSITEKQLLRVYFVFIFYK